jgi:hypothetical protein
MMVRQPIAPPFAVYDQKYTGIVMEAIAKILKK